jgi:DMSO/TMAO reductase YedYZ molybdopterin-dependent catalytic subunit/uncharacterized membrane protein YgdD (TMEM256/DUF423 family)
MRTRTAFIVAALVAAVLAPAAFAGSAGAAPVAPGVPTGSFTITGSVSRPVTMTVAELAQFPTREVTATYGSAKGPRTHTYGGALLSDVMAYARPVLPTGTPNPQLRLVVTFVAADGYQLSLGWGEFDATAGNRPILLAYWMDGRPLNTEGPRLALPGDDHGGRYVDSIRTITVSQQSFPAPPSSQSGDLIISGAVKQPTTLHWNDLDFMPKHFVDLTSNGSTRKEAGPYLSEVIAKAGGLTIPDGVTNGMLRFVAAAVSKTDEAVVDYGKGDPEGAGTDIIVSVSEDGQSLQSTGARLVIASEPGVGRDVTGLHTLNVTNPDPSNVVPAGLADDGVRVVTAGGIITSEGGASSRGDLSGKTLKDPIVAADTATIPDSYWLVASDGGVFNFGGAPFLGSLGDLKLNKPIVDIAATQSGKGYWLAASDGGVFGFGDAVFSGSLGSIKLNQPIVDIVATPTGKGYWLVASDGGVFAFGDAPFNGSMGAGKLAQPVVSAAATPSGKGYWLLAADGGVFALGDAFYSGRDDGTAKDALKIVPSAAGAGYRIVHSDATVTSHGTLPALSKTSSAARVVTATS